MTGNSVVLLRLGVKAFEKEAEKVMLDLGGDDQQTTHKAQAQKKW